ncbi:iron-containing alcohol dehydrogenase [Maridesulfovibrio salexigens]|uniref:Iron-containing alcohol dehydrogenase n=1 Tax=Maridesulfovibrio salexigens (strain ATCC 14822 / DSM 2638 / NCIMB 8403 / VKM B-1763) TaxID=526222 RepID=C6BTC4_MARSD|nr:iron-containing alcohol dehydrogenase [Maridesulfovibrio salexigens]ACS81605.1 iron-containing alcohol dehydrogenase [Maridesulfovibrio salexigens DSM 2638]
MNFEFQNPTKIIFGAGTIARLGEVVSEYGKKAMIVTGGGSVKRTGAFDKAVESLKSAGLAYVECTDVEPNPRITSVARGAKIAKDEGCDVIIALGGGSTMDAAKVMGAAALYDGNPWDMILHGQEEVYIPTETLPVITVPTLAATGSEANCGAVITNDETKIKSFIQIPLLFPKVALVDPELTVSVPQNHSAYGVCDIITHVMEGYFNGVDGTPIQDRFAEGVIINAIEYGRKAVANDENLEARAHVQWASIVALNGWVQAGVHMLAPMHMIEHALSAHHDLTHGAGLAIVGPAWMRFAAKYRPERFAQFAQRVFGLSSEGKDALTLGMEGIDAYETFLREIGCPTTLSEVNITGELFEQYAKDAALVVRDEDGKLLGRPPMTTEDIVEVLKSAL